MSDEHFVGGYRCDRHVGDPYPARCYECTEPRAVKFAPVADSGFCSAHDGYPAPCARCIRDAEEETSPARLGLLLTTIRERAGMTAGELAQELHALPSYVERVENDTVSPSHAWVSHAVGVMADRIATASRERAA